MSETIPQLPDRDLNNGDRVQIRQGQRSIPDLIGHIGTSMEVFRVPLGSCIVLIDNDPEHQREWFLYRDEIAAGAA